MECTCPLARELACTPLFFSFDSCKDKAYKFVNDYYGLSVPENKCTDEFEAKTRSTKIDPRQVVLPARFYVQKTKILTRNSD